MLVTEVKHILILIIYRSRYTSGIIKAVKEYTICVRIVTSFIVLRHKYILINLLILSLFSNCLLHMKPTRLLPYLDSYIGAVVVRGCVVYCLTISRRDYSKYFLNINKYY